MDFETAGVAASKTQLTDITYKITTRSDTADLVRSIAEVGLLQPPVVIGHADGPYRVVSGFRRIAACQALNLASFPARILPADTPPMACVRIAISDNAFQRPLNLVEQSRAYALIRRFSDPTIESWGPLAASVGLPDSRTAMDRITPLAGMPQDLQAAVLEGSVALPVALRINQYETADGAALCSLLRRLSTNLNLQRELLTLISEIALRDEIGVATLIAGNDIAAHMGDTGGSVPQKVQALRRMLKRKRYPQLSKAEADYDQALQSLHLNPRLRLQPPPFFEGSSYRLTLTVSSRRQLQALQSDLQKLIEHPDLLPE